MKFRTLFLPGLMALTLAHTAGAAPITTIDDGDSLAASCHLALTALDRGLDAIPGDQQAAPFVCMAYLAGVIAAARHANELARLRLAQVTGGKGSRDDFNLYCFDWNVRYGDAARIVLRYARQHLDLAHQPAERLAMKALQDAWPCRR